MLNSARLIHDAGLAIAVGYLDPSLGAMILSAIVGIFATITMSIKGFWYKVTGIFRKKRPDSDGKK